MQHPCSYREKTLQMVPYVLKNKLLNYFEDHCQKQVHHKITYLPSYYAVSGNFEHLICLNNVLKVDLKYGTVFF